MLSGWCSGWMYFGVDRSCRDFGEGDLEGWRRIFGSSRRHYFRAQVLLSPRHGVLGSARGKEGEVRLDSSVPLTPIPIIVKWGKESYRGNSTHTHTQVQAHTSRIQRDALRINRKNYTQRRLTWNGTISFTGGKLPYSTSTSVWGWHEVRSSLRVYFALNNWYVYYYVVAKTRSFVRLSRL